jgi:tRNA (cytidine32/uridine32-2'-O)-methyltransferase
MSVVLLKKIRVVLVNPSHPGNIGAVARSMKNMGLTELCLVNPKNFPNHEASERASGAADILVNAKVFENTADAVKNCTYILATSSRERTLPWPKATPEQAADILHERVNEGECAILFGAERTGLVNEDLQLADKHLIIPANPEYTSLNLAQAVQIVSYEIWKKFTFSEENNLSLNTTLKASKQEFEGMISHFEEVLTALDIWDPSHPKKLMPKIRRLLTKAECETDEINILRGLLKAFHSLVLENKAEIVSNT